MRGDGWWELMVIGKYKRCVKDSAYEKVMNGIVITDEVTFCGGCHRRVAVNRVD